MLAWTLKTALLQGLALLIRVGLKNHPAAIRRRVLVLCLLAVCTMPLAALVGPGLAPAELVPALDVSSTPAAVTATVVGATASAVRAEVDGMVAESASHLPLFLLVVWLTGVAALSARWAVGLLRAHRSSAASSPVSGERWSHIMLRLTNRRVPLSLSSQIASPMTVGVVRPVIVLPEEAEEWPEAELSMALAHELAHIERQDTLWINLSLLVRAVQWPNPLAWWLHAQLRLEMERAADEQVIDTGAARHGYARFLLDLARRAHPVTELAMARPRDLERRLSSLGSTALHETSRVGRWIGLGVLALGVGLGCLHANGASAEPSGELQSGDWQGAVNATAQQLRAEHPGATVRIGVMRVDTGELLASSGAVDEPYGSGSTVKPLTVTAALEEGVPLSTKLDCAGGMLVVAGREIRDNAECNELTMAGALAQSANVATAQLLHHMPPDRLFAWLEKFGVDPARVNRDDPAGVATGTGIDLSVRELLSAYATIANRGTDPSTGREIVQPETSTAVLGMLAGAVNDPDGTGKRARVEGTTVAGKTGTTDRPVGDTPHRAASFVGLVPAIHPQWAIAVAVDGADPKSYGGSVAAPAFARIVQQAVQ